MSLAVLGVAIGSTSPYFDRVEVMRASTFGLMGLSALVIALTLEQTRFSPPSWLVRIGDASYSLYLLHTFLLDASGRVRMNLAIASPDGLLVFMAMLPLVIVAGSWLWYVSVERPIMKAAL